MIRVLQSWSQVPDFIVAQFLARVMSLSFDIYLRAFPEDVSLDELFHPRG